MPPVVVLLSFLLLTAVFRSLLIPLVASIMNLLSIAAALGALNAVFNLGWGASLLGLTAKGPIDAFIPVLMFSVLFGLSTDYEVYLVSRIQEEWQRLNPTRGHPLITGEETPGRHQPAGVSGDPYRNLSPARLWCCWRSSPARESEPGNPRRGCSSRPRATEAAVAAACS